MVSVSVKDLNYSGYHKNLIQYVSYHTLVIRSLSEQYSFTNIFYTSAKYFSGA